MSPFWYRRYIPCVGVELEFDQFDLYEIDGRTIVHLNRHDPKTKGKVRRKHIEHDFDQCFREIQEIDFEVSLSSISGDGIFNFDYVHVFLFLLMIRTGGWVSAPAVLTHSTLDDPESDGPHISCSSFVAAKPAYFGDFRLTLDDARWIKLHLETGLRLVHETKFQNAMQALTSFHCIPYSGACLVVAWSGLEALFGVDQEISFRLSLYAANFLKAGDDRYPEFEKLRRSYDDRSRVAHGAATKVKAVGEHAMYTRDILRACLAKCVETNTFPDPRQLVFG